MKYGSRKSTCGSGHLHDSRKEAVRCNELHLLLRAGLISGLLVQPEYELIPAGKYKGSPSERSCKYIADFQYCENGLTVVEDVKGMRTKDYIIKRKLFKHLYCKDGRVVFREV